MISRIDYKTETMLITYSLQIVACDILLTNIPKEIENTNMLIVYRIHNTNMELCHEDIVGHKEVTFILNIPAMDLVPEIVTMEISLFKLHPRGANILIGNIEVNIKFFVNLALMTMGNIVPIPGYYVLKNNETSSISLTSTIQLMIVDENELGAGDGERHEPEHRGGSDGYSTASSVSVRAAGDGSRRIEAIYRS